MPNRSQNNRDGTNEQTTCLVSIEGSPPDVEVYQRRQQYVDYMYVESFGSDSIMLTIFLSVMSGFLGAWLTTNKVEFGEITVFLAIFSAIFWRKMSKTRKNMLDPEETTKTKLRIAPK